MPDLLQESRKAIADRIIQLEREVNDLTAKKAELQRLRVAYDALGDGSRAPAPRRRSRTRTQAQKRTSGRERAPRGQNRQKILTEIGNRPGASAGEIANATKVKRNVAYTTIAKLKKEGLVKRTADGGLEIGS